MGNVHTSVRTMWCVFGPSRRPRVPQPAAELAVVVPPTRSKLIRAVLVMAGVAVATGCATYRDDLDRAVGHYDGRRYDQALALLSVLEDDIDSLSEAERAEYAYYRGMSHFLLDQRLHARHWLGRAAARERKAEGALQPGAKSKVEETLDGLNRTRYGGPVDAETATSDDEPAAATED